MSTTTTVTDPVVTYQVHDRVLIELVDDSTERTYTVVTDPDMLGKTIAIVLTEDGVTYQLAYALAPLSGIVAFHLTDALVRNVHPGDTVELLPAGVHRVLNGQPGDRLTVDKVTAGSWGPVAHARDEHGTLWSLPADGYDVVTAPEPVATQRLATVTEGSTIAWSAPMPSSDCPDLFLHVGVVGREMGDARLGNQGRNVADCPCGFTHNVSRYTPVVVISAEPVRPATQEWYEDNTTV